MKWSSYWIFIIFEHKPKRMYQLTGSKSYQINPKKGDFSIDGTPFNGSLKQIENGSYLLILENKVIPIELIEVNGKEIKLKYNGIEAVFTLEDELDLVISQLGLKNTAASKHDTLKAPMPGLIIDIRVKEGDKIKKGDVLLILEAMKMENVIKATHDGEIKKILIKQSDTVEKNQLLIQF